MAGFYFYNFHFGLSVENGNWGTFGDYIGGILNPVIAGFAFYLIAKSYELQKRELEATRSLLEVSTEAQKQQIKLAALTALLNSNLENIGLLASDKNQWLQSKEKLQSNSQLPTSVRDIEITEADNQIWAIGEEIDNLKKTAKDFERKIESLLEVTN